jgi:hypothetical protein
MLRYLSQKQPFVKHFLVDTGCRRLRFTLVSLLSDVKRTELKESPALVLSVTDHSVAGRANYHSSSNIVEGAPSIMGTPASAQATGP